MENKKIFNETNRIENEIISEQKKIEKLNLKRIKLMELCSHDIVFKYNDNHPRKKTFDGHYFCPACGKTIICVESEEFKQSVFKNSRIISLIDLSILGTKNIFFTIRNEVCNNMDFYYNPDVSSDELSNRMKEILFDKQYDYKSFFEKEDSKKLEYKKSDTYEKRTNK